MQGEILKKFRSLAACLFAITLMYGQDLSNKGRDFWITYPAHVDGNTSVLGVYITASEDASGNIQAGATNIPFSIKANTVRRVFIGPGGEAPNTAVYLSQNDGVVSGAAIHVTSARPVVVYAHIIKQNRSGASLILPSAVWGREYIVPSYSSAGQSGPNSGVASVTIVAKETNTVVEITPKAKSLNGARPAGTPYNITLPNPGDVYQVLFETNADISGTIVKSVASGSSGCKPIAVFSATTWSAFDCVAASGGDNLYQQLFPVIAFGKSFLTAPYFNRANGDIVRVFVPDPTTVVTMRQNGSLTTLNNLSANGFYEFKTTLPTMVQADKPVSVVQYITSQTCAPIPNPPADPEMIILSPVEQTINDITVFSAHQNFVPPGQSNVTNCYLNIIIKTVAAGTFKINGSPPKSVFNAIPGTGYSYLQEDVSALSATNPVQTLHADSSFSAIAYGFGDKESYGYNAGTNVKDLYQFITIRNQYATVNYPATCINTPFKFSITLPFQPTKLAWQFKGIFSDVTVNTPVYDSSYKVNNRVLYRYSLPNNFSYPNIGNYPVTVVANNPGLDGCSGEQIIEYDLEVFDKPKPRFSVKHSGCLTDPVSFKDSSNSNGITINRWIWNFGDNTSSTVKDPVKQYAAAGSFSVTESIITEIGCLADTTAIINVSSQPVAFFSTSGPLCSGKNLVFNDASTISVGLIAKWIWDLGNGRKDTLLSGKSPLVSYQPGTYTVSLTVQASSGCTSKTFSRDITVTNIPVPDFDVPAAVCLPKAEAKFLNKSTIVNQAIDPLTYLWDFGDGTSDNSANPVHFYNGAGPFSVKLTATSKSGCAKDTVKALANLLPQPKAAINGKTEICLGDSIKLNDASAIVNQSIIKFYWDNGSGKIDSSGAAFSAKPITAGNINIKHWVLTDKGCLSDTVAKPVLVNASPVASFNVSAACENKPITFTNQSTTTSGTITRWQWLMGDGSVKDFANGNPFQYQYTGLGNWNAALIVTSSAGCVSDTFNRQVSTKPLPTANFGFPQVCLKDGIVAFSDSSISAGGGVLIYAWNFGDGNANAANPNTSAMQSPSHKYTAALDYAVTLQVTSENGCQHSVTKTVTINGDKPKADFDFVKNNICSNEALQLINQSTVNSGKITKLVIYWNWPSVAESSIISDPVAGDIYKYNYPVFSAPASKTVNIRLLAFSGSSCENELIKSATLGAGPKVSFIQMPGICLNSAARQITQANVSGNVAGTGVFSGPAVLPDGLFDPSKVAAGTYEIKYTFSTTSGCIDSAKQIITVWPLPTARFKADAPACATAAVSFSDSSSAGFGRINQWNWNFGDGTNSTKNDAGTFTKAFALAGNFSVQLQVITDSGCISSIASTNIEVHPDPKADFSVPANICVNTPAVFTNQSTISDNSADNFTYQWQISPGSAGSALKNPPLVFTSTAMHNVSLTVTSKDGCKNMITKQVKNISPQPLAAFDASATAVCANEVVSFRNISNALGQTINSWNWSFADGQTASTENASATWTLAGTKQVDFYYTTAIGCHSDTASKTILVSPVPVVNAGPDIYILQGGQKQIMATVSGSTGYQYEWTPATRLSNPFVLQPIVSSGPDITYKLTVVASGGCTSSDELLVRFLDKPLIPTAFSPNGDGINDTWLIRYIDSYSESTIQVFDRYGRQVYSGKGGSTPWDGKEKGQMLPAGVYYFVIDLKIGKPPITGSVVIIR